LRELADLAWLTARPIAHRGYHDAGAGRIENTEPAFQAAIARGFAIECDVRATVDGEVVVFHDATLERLTEAAGAVSRMPLEKLRKLRLRGGDARIPTIEELLDLTDGRTPLVIELKPKPDATEDQPLANAVAAALANYSGPVAVMSFEPRLMIAMRSLAPHLPRGMIVDATDKRGYPSLRPFARFARRHLLAAPVVLPSFTACDLRHLPASAPLALRHFFHLPALTWTVRSPADRAAARGWADQIIFEGFDPDA
jgi:glycerophosphoryl diester phosphodiesterase